MRLSFQQCICAVKPFSPALLFAQQAQESSEHNCPARPCPCSVSPEQNLVGKSEISCQKSSSCFYIVVSVFSLLVVLQNARLSSSCSRGCKYPISPHPLRLLLCFPHSRGFSPHAAPKLLVLLGAMGNLMLMLCISNFSLSGKWWFWRYWGKQGGINTQQKPEEKSMYVGKVQPLQISISINQSSAWPRFRTVWD